MLPHPVHAIMSLEQRRSGLLAESAYERQARIAAVGRPSMFSPRRDDLFAIAIVLLAMGLVVVATQS